MRDKLTYLAAMIDGEGYLNLYMKTNGSLVARFGITNTNPKLMDWLKENFGGCVYGGKDNKHTNRKAFRMWYMSGVKMIELLKQVRPYLLLKTEQADTVLEAWEKRQPTPNRVGARGPSVEVLDQRKSYVEYMHKLNKKGVIPLAT